MVKKRKEVLPGKTLKFRTAECGSFYLILNIQDDELFEVKMELGKSGNCTRILLHLMSILISSRIQLSDDVKDLIKYVRKHLVGVSCGCPTHYKGVAYKSCIHWAGVKILEELKNEKQSTFQ